jgi:hypothetical protein
MEVLSEMSEICGLSTRRDGDSYDATAFVYTLQITGTPKLMQ